MKLAAKIFTLFFISATTAYGQGGHSNPPDPPTSPRVVSFTSTGAVLTWVAPNGVSNFEVDWTPADGGVDISKNIATLSGLTPGTTYSWKVRSEKNGEFSTYADGGGFTTSGSAPPPPPPPTAPSPPTVTNVSATSNSASFKFGNVPQADSYNVDVLLNGSIVNSGSTTDHNVAAVVDNLQPSTTYQYNATVTVGGVTSSPTSGEFVTLAGAPPPPPPPTIPSPPSVTVTATSNTASFKFGNVPQADSYNVDVLLNGSIVNSGSTTDHNVAAVVDNLQPSTTYHYKATVTVGGATSNPTEGDFSTQAGAPPPPPPPPPTKPPAPTVNVTQTSNSASFTFTRVDQATSYDVDVLKNGAVVNSGSTTNPSKAAVVSGLQPSTAYKYSATVTVGSVESDPATGDFSTIAGAPSPPSVSISTTYNSATFSFDPVAGGSFDLQIFSDSKYKNNVDRKQSNGDPVTVGSLLANTQYYYQAKVTVAGYTSDAATGSFTTQASSGGPPSAPSPLPATNVTAATATLNWTASANAASYDFEVYGNNPGKPIFSGSATSTSANVSGLSAGKTYSWRIRAVNASGASDWVQSSLVTPVSPPRAPSVLSASPTSDGATLTWQGVIEAVTYDIEILDSQTFQVVDGKSVSTTSVTFTKLSGGTKYNWHVRAVNDGGNSDWVSSDFTTLSGALAAPTNLKVSDVASTSATLTWDGGDSGVKFELEVSPGNIDDKNATSPYNLSKLTPKTTYAWQVRAVKGNSTSAWATAPSFTTTDTSTSAGGLSAPTNLAVSNVTSTTATLTWGGSDPKANFEVTVSPGDFGGKNVSSPYTLSKLTPGTEYTWQVMATKGNSKSVLVPGPSFTTTDTSTSAGGLSAPTNLAVSNVTSTTATLTWGGSDPKANFEVTVSPGDFGGKNVSSPYTLSKLTPGTEYTWQVRTTKGNSNSGWSSGPSFKTDTSTSTGGLSAPTSLGVSNVTSTTATLTWGGSDSNAKFEIAVSPGDISDKNASSPYSLKQLTPGTEYTWQVRTTKGNNNSGWAIGLPFKTLDATAPPSPPRVTFSTASSSVTFTFAAVSGATSYDVTVLDKQGNQTIVVGGGSTADPPQLVVVTGLQPNSKYDYEATVTVSGQQSQAATGSFTTQDASALPSAPSVNVAVEKTTVTFTFTPVPEATSYDVRVLEKQGSVAGSGSTTDPATPVVITGLRPKSNYSFLATVTVSGQMSQARAGSFATDEGVTAVEVMGGGIPRQMQLSQNYPNPFNPSTNIEFAVPTQMHVRISVFSTLGVLVHELVNGTYSAGRYLVRWDGATFPSGIYFCRIQTNEFSDTKRMLLIK